MNDVFAMIVITALAALYGLAWHNQPAREVVIDRRPAPKANPHE